MFSPIAALTVFATVLVSVSCTDHSIDAAVRSSHTIQLLPVKSEHTKDHQAPVVDINSNQLPLTVRFNSHSSNINVVQKHLGHPAKVHNATHTDDPDELIHHVNKPIIQRVHEIVHPYRIITQEIRPAQERIETIVARDNRGGRVQATSNTDNSLAISSSNQVLSGNAIDGAQAIGATNTNNIQFGNLGNGGARSNADPNNFEFSGFNRGQSGNNPANFDFPGFRTSQAGNTAIAGNNNNQNLGLAGIGIGANSNTNANNNPTNFDFGGFRDGQTNNGNAANTNLEFAGFNSRQANANVLGNGNVNPNLALSNFGGAQAGAAAVGTNANVNGNNFGFSRVEVINQQSNINPNIEFSGFESNQNNNNNGQQQLQQNLAAQQQTQQTGTIANRNSINNNIVISNPNVERDNERVGTSAVQNNVNSNQVSTDESSNNLQFRQQVVRQQQQEQQQESKQSIQRTNQKFMQSKKISQKGF